jgi:hypothetical protein
MTLPKQERRWILQYKFEHLYKPDGTKKTCEELIAEDVTETIEALEKQGRPRNVADIYEAIEQRVSLDDIRKVLMKGGTCQHS